MDDLLDFIFICVKFQHFIRMHSAYIVLGIRVRDWYRQILAIR